VSVVLVPFSGAEDWEYLLDLAGKDEGRYTTREAISEKVREHGIMFWSIIADDVRIGIGLCLRVNDIFLLEALKDRRVSGASLHHSVEAGKLLLEEIFKITNVVQTCARTEDRAIQILCRKLGFIETGIVESPFGDLVWFRKEKT